MGGFARRRGGRAAVDPEPDRRNAVRVELAQVASAIQDQPRPRPRRRQPFAARGRRAGCAKAAAPGDGRFGRDRGSSRSTDRHRRYLDQRRAAVVHGPQPAAGRRRGRADAQPDTSGGPDRQPRLGRPGRRFDPRRPDPDRQRHRASDEGRDERRSRRRPAPDRSRWNKGNHGRDRRRQPRPRGGPGRRES